MLGSAVISWSDRHVPYLLDFPRLYTELRFDSTEPTGWRSLNSMSRSSYSHLDANPHKNLDSIEKFEGRQEKNVVALFRMGRGTKLARNTHTQTMLHRREKKSWRWKILIPKLGSLDFNWKILASYVWTLIQGATTFFLWIFSHISFSLFPLSTSSSSLSRTHTKGTKEKLPKVRETWQSKNFRIITRVHLRYRLFFQLFPPPYSGARWALNFSSSPTVFFLFLLANNLPFEFWRTHTRKRILFLAVARYFFCVFL